MDASEDVMDSIAVVDITENTGRRKRKNTPNNCASKKTKKQTTSSQLKMVEETIASRSVITAGYNQHIWFVLQL